MPVSVHTIWYNRDWCCSNNIVINVAPGPPVRLTNHVFLLCRSFATRENYHKHICMGEVVISNVWLTFWKAWFQPKPWSFSKPNIVALLPKPHQTVREQWKLKKKTNKKNQSEYKKPTISSIQPSMFPLRWSRVVVLCGSCHFFLNCVQLTWGTVSFSLWQISSVRTGNMCLSPSAQR